MAEVSADPDKLRELGKRISSAGQQLDSIRNQVSRAVANADWKDSERARFEQEIGSDLKTIAAAAQRLQSQYPAVLERKARALDDFRR